MENRSDATSLWRGIFGCLGRCFCCDTKQTRLAVKANINDDTDRKFELTTEQSSSTYLTVKKYTKELEQEIFELKSEAMRKNKEIKILENKLKNLKNISEENYKLDTELDIIARALNEKDLLIASLTRTNAKLKEQLKDHKKLSTELSSSYPESISYIPEAHSKYCPKNYREHFSDINFRNNENPAIIVEVIFIQDYSSNAIQNIRFNFCIESITGFHRSLSNNDNQLSIELEKIMVTYNSERT